MKTQTILSKILYALEIALALRIFLFTIPVFVSEWTNTASATIDNRFIITLTIFALGFLVSGTVSFFNASLGKILHYVSLALILGCIFVNKPEQFTTYGALIAAAVVLTLAATFLKSEPSGRSS